MFCTVIKFEELKIKNLFYKQILVQDRSGIQKTVILDHSFFIDLNVGDELYITTSKNGGCLIYKLCCGE